MRQFRTLLPAIVLALAVTGCGEDSSDDDDNDDSSDTPSVSVPTDLPTSVDTSIPTDVETDLATDDGEDTGATGCILTDDDILALTEIDGAAEDGSVAGTTICNWTSTSGANVNLSIKAETGTFDATVSATESVVGPAEDLPGVGDEAVIMYTEATLPQAAVITQVGDQLVALIYTDFSGVEADMRSAITDMATAVANGL
ncbi:hypothetical protein [Nocardioides stalactiti]|uniref:hypothetical protein n=1 Tax=Nocardioides stalactiti TaxID=2755356 RepID=UPI001603875B|nr:hypothetical protein [Nocardioides stalactiti]